MLVPLAIINHFKPTRPLQTPVTLDELYPEGYHERDLALPPDPEWLTWRNMFIWLDRLRHKFAELWVKGRDSSCSGNARLKKWQRMDAQAVWKVRTDWRRFFRRCSMVTDCLEVTLGISGRSPAKSPASGAGIKEP